MIPRRNFAWLPPGPPAFLLLTLLVLLLVFTSSGCKSRRHTSDARLKKIDQMLNAQLPPGTQRARVEYFLSSRGYRIQNSQDKNSVVAVVRQIDTETLQPATARVAFHFDSNNKLLSYELQAAPDAPLQP
ncbi:MAG: hypothetical protein ACYDCG_17555 [Candidatus Acidiferrales bacterium]